MDIEETTDELHAGSTLSRESRQSRATFQSLPTLPGRFFAQLNLKDFDPIKDTAKLPTRDALIEITVPEGGNRKLVLRGIVCDDFFGSDAHLNAFLASSENAYLDATSDYDVEIEILDDTVADLRQMNAFRNIAISKPRTRGPNIKALFSFTSPSAVHTASLRDEFFTQPGQVDRMREVLRRPAYRLNESQMEAAKASFSSDTGMYAIWGPPGTGKTYTSQAIAEALATVGLKVAVVCTDTQGIDVALERFKRNTQLSPLSYARFRGGRQDDSALSPYVKPMGQVDKKENELHIEQQRMSNEMWDTLVEEKGKASTALEIDSYHAKLQALIGVIGRTPNDGLYVRAIEHRTLMRKMFEEKSRERLRELRQMVRELRDGVFAQRYLSKVVKVLFTTMSLTVHPTLLRDFDADVIIVEEAAQTTLQDLAQPLAANWSTVQLVILPVARMRQDPIFISGNKSMCPNFELKIQYRMHRDISAWISSQLYDNQLQTMTPSSTQLQQTVLEMFGGLPEAVWNRHRRVVVDVSSNQATERKVFSTLHKGTPSACNEWEARIIVEMIRYMLNFQPTVPRCPAVKQEDIVVISPYNGQRWVIRHMLQQLGFHSVKVWTTNGAQGKQGHIVFVSLMENSPEQSVPAIPSSFISNPEQLNIAMSRAQDFLFIMGNFRGWAEAMGGQDPRWAGKDTPRYALRSLVRDCLEKGDIVSMDDFYASMAGTEVDSPTFDCRKYIQEWDKTQPALMPAKKRAASPHTQSTKKAKTSHRRGERQKQKDNNPRRADPGRRSYQLPKMLMDLIEISKGQVRVRGVPLLRGKWVRKIDLDVGVIEVEDPDTLAKATRKLCKDADGRVLGIMSGPDTPGGLSW